MKETIEINKIQLSPYTISDLQDCFPTYKKMIKVIQQKIYDQEEMPIADKIALGLMNEYSQEDKLFLKLKLKAETSTGELFWTKLGVKLGLAITMLKTNSKKKLKFKERKKKAKLNRKREKLNKKRS